MPSKRPKFVKPLSDSKPLGPSEQEALDRLIGPLKSKAAQAPERTQSSGLQSMQDYGQPYKEEYGQQDESMASNLAIVLPNMASNLAIPEDYGQQKNQEYGQPRSRINCERYRNQDLAKVTIRISKPVLQKVKVFCAEKNIPLQEFWERMASHSIETMASNLAILWPETMASNLAHDDMMMSNTKDDVIMAYERFTGQAWNRKDDREGRQFNNTDIRIVEAAIIHTLARKLSGTTSRQPVKSFNYFVAEIKTLVEQVEQKVVPNVGEYHRYALKTWEAKIKPLRDQKWNLAK